MLCVALPSWGLSSRTCEWERRLCQVGLGLPDAESWEVQTTLLKHLLCLQGPTHRRPAPYYLFWLTSQKQPLSALGSWKPHSLSVCRAVPGLCRPHSPWDGNGPAHAHRRSLSLPHCQACCSAPLPAGGQHKPGASPEHGALLSRSQSTGIAVLLVKSPHGRQQTGLKTHLGAVSKSHRRTPLIK